MKRPTKRAHEQALRALGCIVSGRTSALELHHCHGGSMLEAGFKRGGSLKPSDWLQIPLADWLHTGDQGVDRIGVITWEARFGRQLDHLARVSEELGYDVLELARSE